MDIDRRMNDVAPCDLRNYLQFIDRSLSFTSGNTCRLSSSGTERDGSGEPGAPIVPPFSVFGLTLIKPKGRGHGPELYDLIHVSLMILSITLTLRQVSCSA